MFPLTYTSNIVVDLFPTTTKTRKYQNTLGRVRNCKKHQSERVVACGDRSIDVKGRWKIAAKALDFRHFSVSDSFECVERVIVCGNLSKGNPGQKV